MKLTASILLMSTMLVSASIYSQKTKLTLKFKGITYEKLFQEIEKQTEFRFAYSKSKLDPGKKLNVNVSNVSLESILNQALPEDQVSYLVIDRYVVITDAAKGNFRLMSQKQKTITGKIIDENGEPIAGVTIAVKGTALGTITDIDGKYTLEVPDDAKVIIFSYVGMETQEINYTGQSVIDVVLVEDTKGLEEVVVIGYGTVKKKDLTGAVGSVDGSAISERQTTHISNALQGAIPGVMVTRNNNSPGSTATIRIRGITTIGDNSPLIIVDGVPVGSINDVNPNDVESISVLKDGASASIYGARAAAGVILITTKRAKEGDLNLTYNVEYGLEKPTAWPEYVDVIKFMKADNELRWNDKGNQGTEYSTYAQDLIENYWSLNAENPNLYPNTDMRALVMKDYAPRTSHNLSISAGSKGVRSKLSLNYDKIDGLYKNKSYDRFTARFNNDVTINNFISASVDMFWKRTMSNDAIQTPWWHLHLAPPVYPAVWDDGRLANGKGGANIYGVIEEGGYKNNWYNNIGGKVSIDITPVKGLKLSAVVAPNFSFDKGKQFTKDVKTTLYEDPTVIEGSLQHTNSTRLNENRNDNYQITTQFLANYIKSFGNHNLNLMAGYENYYAFYENLGASRDQYLLASFPYLNLGPLELRDNSGSAYENAYRSYFGRAMYNYMYKYYLQANIRYDGSSRFHKDYRWGLFPSFSAAWVISEESFMQDIDALSFLKLRASWGTLGNERIGNYPYQASIGFDNALFYQGSQVISAQTAAQWQYAIQDISWETTESLNFGLDVSFLNNRLRIAGDYFIKTTKDMLLALEIPDFLGFNNPDQNTGKMETKGWEANIGWNDKLGELKYSVSFNISDFKSVMGDLGGTEFLGSQIKIEGSEFNEWYGFISDGLFQTQEEVDNSAKYYNSSKPGDVKYVDISGPEGVPDGKITGEYDRVLLGGSLPRYMYGGNIKLNYKGFDCSVVIQGVGKQNRVMSTTMIAPFNENWGNVPEIIDGNYWSVYNTPEENLNMKYPRLTYALRGNNYTMSDYWLFDGGYFRLKNITLGYTLPANITQKLNITRIRLYSSISDLFSIHKFPKGWDPESGGAYPITTSYVFGVSVNF